MVTYILENCPKCGKQPKMWYDSEEFDSLYNIKCCDRHIRDYRSVAFVKWNKEE